MLTTIDHIAIVVEDIEAALQVYRDALGLPLARREEVPLEKVKVAFLPMPQGDGEIELVQPTAPGTGVAKFLANRGEGIHHICLQVENIERAMQALAAKGLQVIEDEPRVGGQGQKYVFIHPKTTHGVLIELYQKAQAKRPDVSGT
ncbi:MAG: methylmalonyl-CoA epimerase [Anaerolineae bacterium]